MKIGQVNSRDKDTKTLIWIVVGLVVFWVVRRDLTNYFRKRELNNVFGSQKNPAQMALLIRNACNPAGTIFGVSAVDFDGTDTAELINLAPYVEDYAAVSASYELQFKESLTSRLQSELSNDDLRKFLSLVGSASFPNMPAPGVKWEKVLARVDTFLLDFKDPLKIVRTVRAGMEIGQYKGERVFKTNTTNQIYVNYAKSFLGYEYEQGWVKKDTVTLK